MSNTSVGQVYAQIINDVVEAAGVDFEEGGVDASVLGELKAGWQRKLSQMGVAAFPWDPKPAPPTENNTPAPQAPAPSLIPNAAYTQSTLSPPPNTAPLSLPGQIPNGLPSMAPTPAIKAESHAKNEPVVKQEPGLPAQQPLQAYHPGPPAGASRPAHAVASDLAQQRAAQNLASKFGSRADAAITSLYNAKPSPQTNPVQPGQQQPGQPQQPLNAAQYRQNMAAQAAAAIHQQSQQAPYPNGGSGLPTSQVDGPNEGYEGIMIQRDADGIAVEVGRVQIDELIHAQIAARAKQMEGGGLMLPLREATKLRSIATKRQAPGHGNQVDGADDIKDEEVDADAINSDLDDPDDDQEDDDEDDESNNHMMLCMYDKVQRVKNKWKCTLKDGVLLVNGREYVFHKATGEYEW